MNAAESVRFVTTQFLQNYKQHLDEDNYQTAKILIDNCPADKVIPKVLKILKPFATQSEKGKLDKESLIKQGWVTDSCQLTKDEISEMGKQAEMAYSLCAAIDDMEPQKLKTIEEMAATIQMGIEAQMSGMSEDEKKNMDPSKVIGQALGGVEQSGEIQTVVNSLMTALMPEKSTKPESKKSLLEAFNQIDGVTKRK